jgi:hypothetical protein
MGLLSLDEVMECKERVERAGPATGHDFSRAETALGKKWALASEGFASFISRSLRSFYQNSAHRIVH